MITTDYPELISEYVSDDGETFEALRCPVCLVIVSEGDLAAVGVDGQSEEVYSDDILFEREMLLSSIYPVEYYQHEDKDENCAFSAPAGWRSGRA